MEVSKRPKAVSSISCKTVSVKIDDNGEPMSMPKICLKLIIKSEEGRVSNQ